MKTGASLTLICIGAILAFAVTGHPSFFNVNTAGWVLMVVGVIGLLLPNRTAGWLGRRLLVRRSYPSGRVERIPVPPYVARNPGVSALEAGLPSRPTLIDNPDHDLIEEAEAPTYQPGMGTLDERPGSAVPPRGSAPYDPGPGAPAAGPPPSSRRPSGSGGTAHPPA
ncbi:MAG TPA: hypothetical protein VIZ43_03915, partial [Trebonia sp.]